jgi:N-acetyl-anhydromuramyl-L-alanine amidase AmpD
MATQFQPNRLEVSDRFPMLGFTVRTDGTAKRYEIAIGTSPDLFGPDGKTHRTRSNFYSTRAVGPLPIERGESVYVLPPEVLVRFVGQQKLYYGLATFNNGATSPEIVTMPTDGSPYIKLSALTGRSLQRVRLLPSRQRGATGYGANGSEMEWSGDAAAPGTKPANVAVPKGNGDKPAASPDPSVHYDDGYGPLPPSPPPEAPKPQAKSLAAYQFAQDDEDSQHDISGPIPDDAVLAQGLAKAFSLTPEYPQASRFEPANSGNFRAVAGTRSINRIVIHITDGAKNIGGTISWFQDPKAKVSAHYIVGQDGEVVQMVKHTDVAWHAGGANGDSIGIEHVARAAHAWDRILHKPDPGLMPTDAQYCASAALVNWLCTQLNVPMDRDHVLGHSEADPKTTHTGCPNAVWNWNYYMPMVTSGTCGTSQDTDTPQPSESAQFGQAAALDAGQGFDENWNDVDVVGQPENYTCWAAAAALVVGWRDRVSMDIQAMKKLFTNKTGVSSDQGLFAYDDQKLADTFGLVAEPPQCYTVEGLRQILRDYGPFWVGIHTEDNWGHAVVVTGMFGDGTEDGTYVRITDPWGRTPGTPGHPGYHNPTPGQGSRYAQTFTEFTKEYEAQASGQGGTANVQILHAADNGGRTIEKGADQSYALSLGATTKQRHRPGQSGTHTKRPNPSRGRTVHAQAVLARAADDDAAAVQSASTTSGIEADDDMSRKLGCIQGLSDQGRGITFVQRYLRNLSRAEALALSNAGLQIVSCYEVGSPTSAAYFTRAQGQRDGRAGFTQAQAIGQPAGTPIYFAVDFDPGNSQRGVILDYVQGVQEGCAQYLADMDAQNNTGVVYDIGVYGSGCVLDWCKAQGIANWFWQAFAPGWCNNRQVWPGANIRTSGLDTPARCGMRLGHLEGWGDEGGWTITAAAEAQASAMRLPDPPARTRYASGQALDGTLPRITGGEGNITWELEQYPGVKMASSSAAAPLQSAETIRLSNWPYCEFPNGARAAAWFKVDWKYSGQSLGQVSIAPAGTQQGPYPLRVEATIEDGRDTDPTLPSLRVTFTYRFSTPEGTAVVATTTLTLYGDGSMDQKSNWIARAAA